MFSFFFIRNKIKSKNLSFLLLKQGNFKNVCVSFKLDDT